MLDGPTEKLNVGWVIDALVKSDEESRYVKGHDHLLMFCDPAIRLFCSFS